MLVEVKAVRPDGSIVPRLAADMKKYERAIRKFARDNRFGTRFFTHVSGTLRE
jgi:hypothetical protein